MQLHIILDNIRSAYNVGSIFRTADTTGCAQLYICGISPYPPNPKLVKTALGATESVKWKYFESVEKAIAKLKTDGIPIYAVEFTENSKDFQDMNYPNEVALILGHEINGVGEFALREAEKTIHIPMRGVKKSLNVATAAGIVMFEAVRGK